MPIPDLILDDYRGDFYEDAPNLPVYAWYLNERERILYRRNAGIKFPWTKDPIYQNFRFTNVFRDDDRVSRQLVETQIPSEPPELRMFNAVVFRTFNCNNGYQVAAAPFGWIAKFLPDQMIRRLDKAHAEGQEIFGNAYLMVNSMTAGGPKHRMYVNMPFTNLWEDRHDMTQYIQDNPSLEQVTKRFTKYPGYADFLGYELALDMEMIGLLPNPVDKYIWANPGPGARRGLNFIFGRPRNYVQPTREFLAEMRWLMDESIYFIAPHVSSPRFDMRCIENGLCETSKYASVMQTGRAKRRYRPLHP